MHRCFMMFFVLSLPIVSKQYQPVSSYCGLQEVMEAMDKYIADGLGSVRLTPSSSKALLVLFHEYIRVDFVFVCLRHCETPSTTEDEILVARASFLVCSVPPRRFSTLCKADGAALSSGTRCVFFVSAIALSCALMDTLED